MKNGLTLITKWKKKQIKNGLTLTIIFEAESGNYGEGAGNVAILKHMNRGNGENHTYISRQTLGSSIKNQMGLSTPVIAAGSSDKSAVQFNPEATAKDYPEVDLFGYLKTKKSENACKRAAVARLSNAISLEPYTGDMDFLTNMRLASQVKGLQNNIANVEIHHSLYSYTLTVDLDLVGIDENDGVSLSGKERAKRVVDLLNCIQHLYHDIKGRRENLAPVFVIGGLYEAKSPYFLNRIKLHKGDLNVALLKEVIENIEEPTLCGLLTGIFKNEDEIRNNLNPVSIHECFDALKAQVEEYYESSQDIN